MKKVYLVLGALLILLMACSPSDDVYEETDVSEEVSQENSSEEAKDETEKDREVVEEKSLTVPFDLGEGIAKENGPLQVIDGQLSNEKGDAIQLKGLSTHGLQWYGSFISDNSISEFKNEWNMEVIRAAMYTTEDGYISQFKNYSLLGMHRTIQLATQHGLYVVVDWHVHRDKDPLLHMDEAKEFFSMIAETYADHTNIIYEICNEPNGNITWSDNVKPYAEEMIPLIRSFDEDAVIIVGTPTWSQDVDAAADDPLSHENVLYTLHFYAGSHGQELRDKATYAMEKGLGIFVTEWGTSRNTGGGGVFLDEADIWLEFLDEHQISWCNWSIADKAETSAIFLPNFDPEREWNEDRISESGKYVRGKLQE